MMPQRPGPLELSVRKRRCNGRPGTSSRRSSVIRRMQRHSLVWRKFRRPSGSTGCWRRARSCQAPKRLQLGRRDRAACVECPLLLHGGLASVYEWAWPEAEGHHRAIDGEYPGRSFGPSLVCDQLSGAAGAVRRSIDRTAEGRGPPIRSRWPISVSVGLLSYFAHRFAQADREFAGCLALDPGLRARRACFLG